MAELTEADIFGCMSHNLRLAAEHCDNLAKYPLKGRNYNLLRQELKLVEGCCRQAAWWREDTRWLPIGLKMAEMHKMVGTWLRGTKVMTKTAGGLMVAIQRSPNELYTKAAAALRMLNRVADELRDKAPPKSGLILPDVMEGPHRQNKPVQVISVN
jgi:hypothetical protein